ncbi:MAG: hypothetical protein GWN58_13975, partial [Anaerolineae bacterium]|nr:hypothetical protein [Anaerolineae bacterium]
MNEAPERTLANVQEHWAAVAEKHGGDARCTTPDLHYRQSEINFCLGALRGREHVLDV